MGRTHVKTAYRARIRQSLSLLLAAVLILALLPLSAKADKQVSRTPIGRSDHGFTDLPASAQSGQPWINGQAGILVELNTGTVLFSKNIHQQMYPASTTKVMTALMALENLDLNDTLTISYNATHDLIEGGFDWRFQAGQVFTIEEALYGLCLNSVNTLGYALAEKMAGNVPDFAVRMNQRAVQAGALHTAFTNPHGLNDPNHLTTVYDMAKILWDAIEIDDYRRIAGTEYYSCAEPKNGQVMNFNHTLSFLHPSNKWYDPRVVCGKTGWTEDASFCRAIYAKEGDRDLICVIFYSEGNNGDNIEADVKRLLDYGFSFPEADLVSLKTSYTIRDGYITGVEPGTTAASFRARVTLQAAGSWVLTDADGQEKDGSSLLQTGDTVRVYAANGIRRYCATVLVYGDVNGDGRINISDLIKVRNHILSEQKLTASFFLTGDVNRDSLINISDLIKIRNHILGENAIPQNN